MTTLPDAVLAHARPHELGPGITLLEVKPRFPSSNSLLLEGGGERVLVDAGLPRPAVEALVPFVDRLVLTHFHFDHTLHWGLFDPADVWMNDVEAHAMSGPDAFAAYVGAPSDIAGDFNRDFIEKDWLHVGEPGNLYAPDGTLELAGHRFELVPSRGHSPAHFLLWEPDARVLFTLDVEFSGLGPWYGWPHCDADLWERDIRASRPLFEEAVVVATSHSPPVHGDATKEVDRFLSVFLERDRLVLEAVRRRGGATLDALVDELRLFYGDAMVQGTLVERGWARYLRFFSAVMVEKHLDRLARDGRLLWDGTTARA